VRELFPAFYDLTPDKLSTLWHEGVFVFDTNMLLNIYRYNDETRDRFFEILGKLNSRIWIPYQVASEYQDNRIEVIEQQLKAYGEVSQAIKNASNILDGLTHLSKKHSFIKIDELIEIPKKALGEANKKLSQEQNQYKREFENLRTSDNRREKIEQLFQDRVGTPYGTDKMLELYRQADTRFELQIPPGWKDKSKKKYNKYGDVILWFQLIDYVRSQKKPIIFVTDDGKSDWYISREESKASTIRPRPELVQEMLVEANVLIHMYQGYEFLNEATKFLDLQQKPNVIEDAKEVSEQNAARSKFRSHDEIWAAIQQARPSVLDWLKIKYPDAEVFRANGKPEYVLRETDGTTIGVVIIPVVVPTPSLVIDKIVEQFELLNGLFGGKELNRLIIFLMCPDLLDTLETTSIVEHKLVVPTNVSLAIGHTSSNFEFLLTYTIPSDLFSRT
jgi:PIN like domain